MFLLNLCLSLHYPGLQPLPGRGLLLRRVLSRLIHSATAEGEAHLCRYLDEYIDIVDIL